MSLLLKRPGTYSNTTKAAAFLARAKQLFEFAKTLTGGTYVSRCNSMLCARVSWTGRAENGRPPPLLPCCCPPNFSHTDRRLVHTSVAEPNMRRWAPPDNNGAYGSSSWNDDMAWAAAWLCRCGAVCAVRVRRVGHMQRVPWLWGVWV